MFSHSLPFLLLLIGQKMSAFASDILTTIEREKSKDIGTPLLIDLSVLAQANMVR